MSGDQGERGPVPTRFADVPVVSADQLDLDAIEARANAATAGPWHEPNEDGLGCVSQGDYGWTAGSQFGYPHYDEDTAEGMADAEFIAHAREDVRALVAEVRRLRAQVERVEGATANMRERGWRYEADKIDRALNP